jgi:hypothetical protein
MLSTAVWHRSSSASSTPSRWGTPSRRCTTKHGHHKADPSREISVALNAATAVELADLCPFVENAYAIEHPFVEAATHSDLSALPREWDWVLDDPRRHQSFQTDLSITTPPATRT